VFYNQRVPVRRRIVDALIAIISLAVLCAVLLMIDGQAGDQLGRVVTKGIATNGGVVAQVHGGVLFVARSAWDLSYVYGPLMAFAGVALALVVSMLWIK
jgi:hypothetical protein